MTLLSQQWALMGLNNARVGLNGKLAVRCGWRKALLGSGLVDSWEEVAGLHLLLGNPFMKHRAPEEPSIIMLGVLVLDQLVTEVALDGLVPLSRAPLDIESHGVRGEEAHSKNRSLLCTGLIIGVYPIFYIQL